MRKLFFITWGCLFLTSTVLSAGNADEWDKKVTAIYNNQHGSDSAKIIDIANLTYDYCLYYQIMTEEVGTHYFDMIQSLQPTDGSNDLDILVYRPLFFLSSDAEAKGLLREKYSDYILKSTNRLMRFEGWMMLGQAYIYDHLALEYLFLALNEVKDSEYKLQQARAYQVIAFYYSLHKNYDKQLKNALKSVALAEESQDIWQMITSWKDLGTAYFEGSTGDEMLDSALVAYNHAIDLAVNVANIQILDLHSFRSLDYMMLLVATGSLYQMRGQRDLAVRYYQESLKIARANGTFETEVYCKKELGVIYHSLGDFVRAEKYLLEAKKMLKDSPVQTMECQHIAYETQLMLGLLYRDAGQYKASVAYYKTGIGLYMQMFDLEIMNENQTAAAYYEAKKRDEDIDGLKTIVELKERQKYFYGGIALVLVLVLLFIYRLYNYKIASVRQHEQQLRSEVALLALETSNAALQARFKQEEISQLQQKIGIGSELLEHKNEILGNVKKYIAGHAELDEYKSKIENIFMQQNRVESNMDEIKTALNDMPAIFYSRLQKHADNNLTPLDLKYCRLIYQNTPSKKMAELLFVDLSTIRTGKYRLKRKLKLGAKDDLSAFIRKVV